MTVPVLVSKTSTDCGRAHYKDCGGVSGKVGIQRNGLSANPDAEINLGAGRVDDLATADDPRAIRLRTGDISRVLLGLSSGDPRKG